jgi:hypothetical protein
MIGNYTELAELKRIIKEYCNQLYANKLDNLNKMDKFLETQLPKLTWEEVDNLNILIQPKKIELIMKDKLPTNKSPRPDGFTTRCLRKNNTKPFQVRLKNIKGKNTL